jgi:putative acetyltransferase
MPSENSTSTIFCRLRAEDDLFSLVALWVASWQEAMPSIDFELRRDWFRDHLNALETSGYVTICAFDQAALLVGFVTVDAVTQRLDQLAVKPSAWGSGVAVRLLDEARRISPHRLLLEVNHENHRAVRFYEREEFQRIGEGVNANSGLRTWLMQWTNGRS